jgi:hypothetical protein
MNDVLRFLFSLVESDDLKEYLSSGKRHRVARTDWRGFRDADYLTEKHNI